MEGGRIRSAAAMCLEVMASNEAYVQKKVRLLDISTDGPAVAAELRARAAELRKQDLLEENAADGGFEVAEWNLGTASRRDALERYRLWWVD